MVIGIDASRYSHSESTGVEWYSWHIINNLIKEILHKKSDKVILYSRDKLSFDNEIVDLQKKHKGRVKTKIISSKRLWTLYGLSREMKSNPPDVLFVPSHVFPLTMPKKRVIMIHDVAFKFLKKSYSFFQYHYLNWSTKFAVKNATNILVPSEATKEDLISYFKCPEKKISVIQHGFEHQKVSESDINKTINQSEIFKYFNIKKNSLYVLFVGRLESKKNLVRLVEGFRDFTETNPDYRLILAGKRGVGFEELYNAAKYLKMLDKVVMPGYVTEEEKAALYKYCKVFAFPSLYEGFGLPILEAYHYKKPVLTSHVSCLPEVAGDAAYYVDPYDSDSINYGLNKVVNDQHYVEKLVRLGEERLKLFSWKDTAKKTLDILHK